MNHFKEYFLKLTLLRKLLTVWKLSICLTRNQSSRKLENYIIMEPHNASSDRRTIWGMMFYKKGEIGANKQQLQRYAYVTKRKSGLKKTNSKDWEQSHFHTNIRKTYNTIASLCFFKKIPFLSYNKVRQINKKRNKFPRQNVILTDVTWQSCYRLHVIDSL